MKNLFLIFVLPLFAIGQIKNMEVPYSVFEYNSGSCNGFRHASGSLIFIPQNAFEMADGSKCNGKIVIKYRELHTQIDMVANGINMILMRNGKRRLLESIGMFEIRAFCNDKPMKLANGKFIQVRMRCLNDIPNIEAFVYNDEKRYWIDAGVPVNDFSYPQMNSDNTNSWGSGAQQQAVSLENDSLGNEIGTKTISNIIGKLPKGYFKGMNVKTMGWCNYDAVIKDEKAVPFTPVFTINTGEQPEYPIYVAYEKKNCVVQYWEDDFAERFVLLPEKGIKIFTVLKDGSVAIVKKEFIDQLNIGNLKGKTFTIPMEKQPGKPKDKAALAEATRLK